MSTAIQQQQELTPLERHQAALREAEEIRATTVRTLKSEIAQRIAELNKWGFDYPPIEEWDKPDEKVAPAAETEVIDTIPVMEQVTVKDAKLSALAKAREAKAKKRAQEKAAPAKKGVSPFQAGTQYDWIYMQIARNGKPVSVTDILRSAATSEFRGLAEVPNRLTVALNGMMSRGAIERVGEKLYAVKGARH